MYVLESETVNDHLPKAVELLNLCGKMDESRNGTVVVLQEPLCVTTTKPQIRTLLCPERKAQPFVDFFDGLFVLAGAPHYGYLTNLHKRFLQYTEFDGQAHGHYGRRIFTQFGFNQLFQVAEELHQFPKSRRCVIQLWDPRTDNRRYLQDVPCNLCVLPSMRAGSLDLTVYNRSNDMFWGMLGVNIVQFSMLQEILAYLIGCPIGRLNQISNNAHAYVDFGPYSRLSKLTEIETLEYSENTVPMLAPNPDSTFGERVSVVNNFLRQLNDCWKEGNFVSLVYSQSPFLRNVVYLMGNAAISNDYSLQFIADENWRKAVEIYRGNR